LFECPVIFDLHNVESQLIANYGKDRKGVVAVAAWLESKMLERMEARIPQRAFGVATVSATDRDTLAALLPAMQTQRLVAAPNGVTDEAFNIPEELGLTSAPNAVFIGHLGWRPNIDGAKWLATEVWPIVRAAQPNAHLQLIGRDPDPTVTELSNPASGISVHANVLSVFPYLARAAVATAPLWTAGGTRLKILEALATGTPVVATSLGALGLETLTGPNVLDIFDKPKEFAAALIEHLQTPAKSGAARMAAAAYRWPHTLTGLVKMVNDGAA
jgi:glycosyltransferase involved in cell wall biosynthesis